MKTSNRFRAFASGAAIAACLFASAEAQEGDLVGTWNCNVEVNDAAAGMTMQADFEMTYSSDGSFEREGQMDIDVAAMQFKILMNDTGTWKLEGLTLTETRSTIEFSSASEQPSAMEAGILQMMQSAAEMTNEETTELTSLTATTMVFNQEGTPMSCNKA